MKHVLCRAVALVLLTALLTACGQSSEPQVIVEQVEVTRVVQVEGESTPQIIVEQVEVTRIVEAAPEEEAEATPLPDGPNGTIIIGQTASFGQMDPQLTQLSSERSTHHAMFDALLNTDADLNPIPNLVTSWEQEDDTTWLMTLRDDVAFHNGEPFNAEVVKYNVERVIQEGFQRFAFLGFLESAEVVDEYTVRLKTKDPFPQFLARMAQFYMVPPGYLEEVGDEAFNLNPIGTGPFKFVEWVSDSHVTQEANEDYWGGAPKARTLVWRVIPDDSTLVSALLADEIDVVRVLSPDQFNLVNSIEGLEAISIPSLRTPLLFFYPDSPTGFGEPLNDVRVRQAINHAINIPAIIDNLLGGQGTQTSTLMLPFLDCFNPDIPSYEYNPDRARELLAEAGYENGFTLDMNAWSNGPSPKPVEVSQVIVNNLADVGIVVNLTTPELQTMLGKQRERAFPALTLWSYGGGAADPDDKFWPVYSVNASNHLLYTDEMQELIDEGRSTLDMERRCEIYNRLQEIVHEEAIIVPLFGQMDLYGSKENMGWVGFPNEVITFNDAVATRP